MADEAPAPAARSTRQQATFVKAELKSKARSQPVIGRPEAAVNQDGARVSITGRTRRRPMSALQHRRLMICWLVHRRRLTIWQRKRKLVTRDRRRDGKRVCWWEPSAPRPCWDYLSTSKKIGVHRSVDSIKLWWRRFTKYMFATQSDLVTVVSRDLPPRDQWPEPA